MLIVRNQSLLDRIQFHYKAQEAQGILDFLSRAGTFRFPRFPNGLFPASGFNPREHRITGYQNVWVRDNCLVAYAHYVMGRHAVAVKNACALAAFLKTQEHRFLKIIAGEADLANMNRPHIRFDSRGREIKAQWSHAQNDALGYFLWFYCRLILDGRIRPAEVDFDLLACFPLFFQAIRFWNDPDSGHWEERRKVEASSIGVVTSALCMLRLTMKQLHLEEDWRLGASRIDVPMVDGLISKGMLALNKILPAETIQCGLARRYDAALLFLIYPMDIVSGQMADEILQNVAGHLQGDYGIRRYLGDSYWATDYKQLLPAKRRSVDYSLDSSRRDALFKGAEEAQWCIFDPIVSIIYGRKYRQSQNRRDLRLQIAYVNRCLGQLTDFDDPGGPYRCPELYYKQSGRYVPNDHTPLLWTQANLWLALQCLIDNLG
jgi:hypothetical protein